VGPAGESFPTFGLAKSLQPSFDDGKALVGQPIGDRYVLLELIGQGGFGWVYRARQRLPSRDVAIKVPRHAARMSKRIEREANVLGNLNHKAIAEVYDAGSFSHPGGASIYIAMELVRGAQPIDRFCAIQKLSTLQRLKLFVKVCDAVAYAHAKGVVHRDLKPSNILVDRSGRPRVIDFGIATILADDALGDSREAPLASPGLPYTATVGLVGTPKYMSPEQRSTGQKIDARADVFALGKVLHDVVMANDQEPAGTTAGGLPGGLEAIHARCLRDSPADRYANAGEFAKALRAWLSANGTSGSVAATVTDRSPRPRGRRGLIVAGLLTSAAVIAALVYPPQPPPPDGYRQSLRIATQALADGNRTNAASRYRSAVTAWKSSSAVDAGFPPELVILGHLPISDDDQADHLSARIAAADPTGLWLAAGEQTGSVRVSPLNAAAVAKYRLAGLGAAVTALQFSAGRRFLAGADEDGRVCLWNLDTIETDASPRRLVSLDTPSPRGRICSVDISCDETRIAAVDMAGRLGIWDCDKGSCLADTDVGGGSSWGATSVCFAEDSNVFVGRPDGTLVFLPQGKPPRPLPHIHGVGPIVLCRSPKGEVVACAGADRQLRAYRGTSGVPAGEPLKLLGAPRAAAWSPDGSRLLVACHSGTEPTASGASSIEVFRVDLRNVDAPLEPLVSMPLSAAVSAMSLATDCCVMVFDDSAAVWRCLPGVNSEAHHPTQR
jgi:serine/threonine protein kinase